MEKKPICLQCTQSFFITAFFVRLFVLDSLNIYYSHLVPSLARISLLLHFVITFNLDIFHILALLKQNIASFIWQEPTRKLSFNSLFTLYGKQQGGKCIYRSFLGKIVKLTTNQPISTYVQSLYFIRNGNHGLLKRKKKVTILHLAVFIYCISVFFLFVL